MHVVLAELPKTPPLCADSLSEPLSALCELSLEAHVVCSGAAWPLPLKSKHGELRSYHTGTREGALGFSYHSGGPNEASS